MEEVELFIRGRIDQWRIQRQCAYKIVEGFRGTRDMPLITAFIPLPYDFEYGTAEQISQEQADVLMKQYQEGVNSMKDFKWN